MHESWTTDRIGLCLVSSLHDMHGGQESLRYAYVPAQYGLMFP